MLAATSGAVGFVLALLGGWMAGEFDDPVGDDSTAIVNFYQGATFDAEFVTGVVLETLGFLLIMAFIAKIADVVGGGAHEASWFGTVIVACAVVATVLTIVTIVALGSGTFRAANDSFAGDGHVVLTDVRHVAYWLSLSAWALVYLTSERSSSGRTRIRCGWAGPDSSSAPDTSLSRSSTR